MRRLFAAMLLAMAPAACAGIAMTMERPDPASPDVVMRWESEGSGPFTLLRRSLGPVPLRLAFPLDRVRDAYLRGVTGPELTLHDEMSFPDGVAERVYQLIDESDGSCSNAGYVVSRRLGEGGVVNLLALPGRIPIRTLYGVLDAYPQVQEVWMDEPERPRTVRAWRTAGGNRGLDAFIPRTRAVRVVLLEPAEIVIVGAAASRDSGVDVHQSRTRAGRYFEERLALPFGITWSTSDDLLCGEEGVDWLRDATGNPTTCTAGVFEAGSARVEQHARSPSGVSLPLIQEVGYTQRLVFRGWKFDLDSVGGIASRSGDIHVVVHDAAGPDECRCADTDGDGDDDCSERLLGTDPLDASSHGPDEDRDGVPDAEDNCPGRSNAAQEDGDADGDGDACDADAAADPDRDRVPDGLDDCPDDFDWAQLDGDNDGYGDACDPCPNTSAWQWDQDGDGVGDGCDTCVYDPVPDPDHDYRCSGDNCPHVANWDQADDDGSGFGDACDCPVLTVMPPDDADVRVRVLTPLFQEVTWADTIGASDEVYDIVGGSLGTLAATRSLAAGAECLASALRAPRYVVAPTREPRWFLVRRRDPCAATSWGEAGAAPDLDRVEFRGCR